LKHRENSVAIKRKKKVQNKAQLLVLLIMIIVCNYSCIEIGYSKAPCDITYFHDDNKQNDTSKVIFVQRMVFDTTANRLSGIVVDSLSNKPISGAKVYITDESKHYTDSTDINGNFSFFKNGLSGQWRMTIFDLHHKCLDIENINVLEGGLIIRIKLHEWLQKKL